MGGAFFKHSVFRRCTPPAVTDFFSGLFLSRSPLHLHLSPHWPRSGNPPREGGIKKSSPNFYSRTISSPAENTASVQIGNLGDIISITKRSLCVTVSLKKHNYRKISEVIHIQAGVCTKLPTGISCPFTRRKRPRMQHRVIPALFWSPVIQILFRMRRPRQRL